MNLPLRDSSLGKEIFDRPETLGLSLREQSSHAEKVAPPALEELACKVSYSPSGVDLIVPIAGFSGTKVFPMAIVLLFPIGGIALGIMAPPTVNSNVTQWLLQIAFLGGFIFVPLVVFSSTVIREATENVKLSVSEHRFVIRRQWWFGKSSTTISTEAIRNLFVSNSCFPRKSAYSRNTGGVVTMFDHEWVAFGGHLREPEQDYLCDVIKAVVTSR